jgi:tetratricopeptide (TPR) repeat protein
MRDRPVIRHAIFLALLLALAPQAGFASKDKPRRPPAAEPALERGEASYQKGDYAAALEAFQQAEGAGARFGMLFYRMAYCQGALGQKDEQLALLGRAVPYFEAEIEKGRGGVDAYYYLAAIYLQDLPDGDRAEKVVARAVEADKAGKLGAELDGDGWFRLGRLYSFAVELADPGKPDEDLEARRLHAYGQAAEMLVRTRGANQVYLQLALQEVAQAALRDRRWKDAIAALSRSSMSDPMRPEPALELLRLGRDLSRQGDLELALEAWKGIRGPDGPKTQANYGVHLLRAIQAYGDLPAMVGGQAVRQMDVPTLERGILDAASFLKSASPEAEATGGFSADPEEVKRQRGIFLALMLVYFERGNDLRTFTVQHRLVPLVFGRS